MCGISHAHCLQPHHKNTARHKKCVAQYPHVGCGAVSSRAASGKDSIVFLALLETVDELV